MSTQNDLDNDKIGTLEFCTALNGDDPLQAIAFLRRFVKTIRREKGEALGEDNDTSTLINEDMIEESDDDLLPATELEQPPPTKKAKVEAWKLDTKSYNVPFVGTSTYKGSCGVVEKGIWPTGFLDAYLKQSPKAIEILGSGGSNRDDLPLVPPNGLLHQMLLKRKENSGKVISTKIFELYIQALGEIATCGIPLKRLQKDVRGGGESKDSNDKNNNSDITTKLEKKVEAKISYERIISTVMKEHLPVLLNVLNNESTNSGRQSYLLIDAVLGTLANFALTSVGAAREIIRELDNGLKEGVLQRLVSRSFNFGNMKNATTVDNSDGINHKLSAQAALLRLASVLIECGDNYIISYSISPGVKETKTKPGIAYFIIRRVASAHTFQACMKTQRISRKKTLLINLRRFYHSIRSNILTSNDEKEVPGRMSLNSIVTFLHGDVLETITRNMLIRPEDHHCADELHLLKLECQMIMTAILTDRRRSPFLKHIHSERSTDNIISSCASIMIRCIQVLLSYSNDTMETRTFVLHCFNESPVLFSRFFRVIQAPEPTSSFATISKYSLLTFMIDNGPQIWNASVGKTKELSADKLISYILPKGLTKNVLSKTLQNSNGLLTMECLKTIDSILNRLRSFMEVANSELSADCSKLIFRRLPDLQVFLSVRAKFDPFVHKEKVKVATAVTISICSLIQNYTSLFLNTLSNLQFDWMKLLPEKTATFCSASLILQSRLLKTLSGISNSYQTIGSYSNTMTSSNAFRTFASIMMQTSDPFIYRRARELSIKTLECITVGVVQTNYEVFHEIKSWVDGMEKINLDTFCKLLDATQKMTVQHPVIVSNACQQLCQPDARCVVPTFTPALSAALVSVASDMSFFSDSFIIFVCQVTFMTLIQSLQPKRLACVVTYLLKEKSFNDRVESVSKRMEALVQYSALLLAPGDNDILKKACCFIGIIFGEASIFAKVAGYLSGHFDSSMLYEIHHNVRINSPITASSILRLCLHYKQFDCNSRIDEHKIVKIFCSLYQILIQEENHLMTVDACLDTVKPLSKLAILITLVSSVQEKDCEKRVTKSEKSSSHSINLIQKHLITCLKYLNSGSAPHAKESTMLAYITTILQHSPYCRIGEILQPILEYCIHKFSSSSKEIRNISSLLNAILKNTHKDSSYFFYGTNLQSVFQLWKVLAEIEKEQDEARYVSLMVMLEALMGEVLLNYEGYGIASSCLMNSIEKEVISSNDHLLWSAKHIESDLSTNTIPKSQFLISLASHDASKLYLSMKRHAKDMNDADKDWDDLVATMIIQGHAQKPSTSIPNSLIEAAINIFQQKMTNNKDKSFGTIMQALEFLVKSGNVGLKSFSQILKRAPIFLQRARKTRTAGALWTKEVEFLDLLLLAASSDSLEEVRNRTVKLALVHVTSSLLKVLKSDVNSAGNLAKFLSTIIEILKLSHEDILQSLDSSALKKMMIACLKFGIEAEMDITSKCLIIVRVLLGCVERASNKNLKKDLLQPQQILAMATSHSNFSLVAARRNSLVRTELIALLLCCVALEGGNLTITDWGCFSALLVGFRASLSYEDYLFRRLLYLYETSSNVHLTSYKQSKFVWGQAQHNLQSKSQVQITTGFDHGENWEPFIESLDVKRIRQTIANFPIYETAEPPQCNEIERAVIDGTKAISTTRNTGDVKTNDNHCEALVDELAYSDDERYSPSFIMPLLLGVLESFARRASIEETENKQTNEVEDMDVDDDNEYPPSGEEGVDKYDDHVNVYRESFAKIVYRLSQKGAISLSLACLSSRCQDIRRMAVSTLYFFIQAIKMDESQSIGQWRERPQIEMILNSVQRGLVVAKVKSMQHDEEGDSSDVALATVPMLPSVSAIFLARSIFIISKPGDSMFSAINKYFLRIEDYHGAFNDCFSLPAFIILFSSANDDNSQARRERLWALQLLKDGIIDEYSYKVVSRRHVPSLLLSSFDGFCSRKSSGERKGKYSGIYDTECSMVLEVVEQCLIHGGYTAYNHFVNVIGIFPWIQAMFESHSKTNCLNESFYTMILHALQGTERYQIISNDMTRKESLPFDAMNILNCVLGAYETEEECDSIKDSLRPSTLLNTVCDIVRKIHQLHKNNDASQDLYRIFQIHCNGVPISTASRIAKTTQQFVSLHFNLIEALCYFPIAMDMKSTEDTFHLVAFTKSALNVLLNRGTDITLPNDARTETYSCIMKRINFFVFNINFAPCSFLNDVEVGEMLLSCRRQMLHAGLYDLWLETITGILPKSKTDIDSSVFSDVKKKQKFEAIVDLIENEKANNNI